MWPVPRMTITEGGKAFTGWPTKGQPSFQAVQGFSGMGLVPRLHSCVLWVQKTPEAWRVSLSLCGPWYEVVSERLYENNVSVSAV